MENNEVRLGDVTYQLSRAFVGSKTASELLVDHIVSQIREDSAVDLLKKPAV